MIRATRLPLGVLLLALTTGTVGCSSDEPEVRAPATSASPADPAPESSSTGTPSSASEPADELSRVTDPDTGWSFLLPAGSEPTKQDQLTGATVVLYADADAGDLQQSVSVSTFPEELGPITNSNPAQQVIDGLTAAGATDAEQTPGRARTIEGLRAPTATIEFTAQTGDKTYWRITSFVVDRTIFTLQTLTFLPEVDAAARAEVDRLQERLEQSVRAPD